MSPERVREVLAVARRHSAFVIEDDFARYLGHDDAPGHGSPMIAEDRDGTVVHVRSLTKATSPNLRVAAVAARGPAMARIRSQHLTDAMMVAAPMQLVALDMLTRRSWKRDLTTLQGRLTERRRVAVEAIRAVPGTELGAVPRGGYHLWVRLTREQDPARFVERALTRQVAVASGEHYTSASPSAHVRISYAAAPTVGDVRAGIERLG